MATNFSLGSRVNVAEYLSESEIKGLQNGQNLPEFCPGEIEEMLEDEDVSSFNDDGVPPSEEEFFTSEWEEDNASNYVPPITRRKKVLIYSLLLNKEDPEDNPVDAKRKKIERMKVIKNFRQYVIKKRAMKAYKRLLKLNDAGITDPAQQAFFLEKLELIDKKLNYPFYYEQIEPQCYKRLLKKRKKAIRSKYELYAACPAFQDDFHIRTIRCAQNIVESARSLNARTSELLVQAEEQFNKMEEKRNIDEKLKFPPTEVQLPQHADQTWPIDEFTEVSSFLDDGICESEIEFFSSPFEEDDLPPPPLNSKRYRKYQRLVNKYHPTRYDDEDKVKAKMLRKAEIDADFANYIENRRATKAMIRYRMIQDEAIKGDIVAEAQCLLHTEILDKKLDRDFYYARDEPQCYKALLGKRRRAVIRKNQKYAQSPQYRKEFESRVLFNYMRIQESQYFDQMINSENEEISSFNGTDIPTSELEFMSDKEFRIPDFYEKPLTRTKAALYEFLDDLEADPCEDTGENILRKRKARLNLILNYKISLKEQRREKALKRLNTINQMCIKDPGRRAIKLRELEILDKQLCNGYYYARNEPAEYKNLLNRRLKAIERKYVKYHRDPQFRLAIEKRIRYQAITPIVPEEQPNYDLEPEMEAMTDDHDAMLFNNIFVGSHCNDVDPNISPLFRHTERRRNKVNEIQ